jgi:2-keto-4-pentenoate hydratase/2-oxohepta-3-ene-1,7-dioic acid hydratase in catechol pathway
VAGASSSTNRTPDDALASEDIMPPVSPTKIVCVGRNYAKHAAELGNEVPAEPLIFLKPPSALIGGGEAIVMPRGFGRIDYEGEIGVIIGRRARRVEESRAWSHVEALVPLNDVTARDLQRRDGQWSRAKGFDTFCPVGEPVPAHAVDPDALAVTTRVNGEIRQQAWVQEMVFSIPFLLAHISRIMTLEPGDLIATGTPEGVGPLAVGDQVEVEVTGVGSVSNPVREESA